MDPGPSLVPALPAASPAANPAALFAASSVAMLPKSVWHIILANLRDRPWDLAAARLAAKVIWSASRPFVTSCRIFNYMHAISVTDGLRNGRYTAISSVECHSLGIATHHEVATAAMKELCLELSRLSGLESLMLACDPSMVGFAAAWRHLRSLRHLTLAGWTESDVVASLTTLSTSTLSTLETIVIHRTGDGAGALLASLAQHLSSLRRLEVIDSSLSGGQPLFESLAGTSHFTNLRHLDLTDTLEEEDAFQNFLRELGSSAYLSGLTHLELCGCAVRGQADLFAQATGLNGLQHLGLANCYIDEEEHTDALLDALPNFPFLSSLTSLDLSDNMLDSIDVLFDFQEVLASCTQLTRLQSLTMRNVVRHRDSNFWLGDLVDALGDVPHLSSTLEVLDISSNIRQVKDISLTAGFEKLRSIDISRFNVRADAATAFAHMLKEAAQLTSLRSLLMSGNAVGCAGAQSLIDAVFLAPHLAEMELLDLRDDRHLKASDARLLATRHSRPGMLVLL